MAKLNELHDSDEAKVRQLINGGATQDAVKLLVRMAIGRAEENDFETAERYRDWLYEVDSMAISAIVQVNDEIEVAKSNYFQADQSLLMQKITSILPAEEANALLFALTEMEVMADHILLSQGESNNRLYFINQGRLKEYYDSEHKQVMIREIGPGQILGEETFFGVNVCTLSAATLTRVRCAYLTRERLDNLGKKYRHIPERLQKMCFSGKKTYDLLRQKGIDRRTNKRINYQTKFWFQLLTSSSQAVMRKPITGELWDISKTGLSFYFHYKNIAAVRKLLGKTLGMRFNLNIKGLLKEISLTGVVHGVQNHPLDEYSVHVGLNRPFSDEAIKTLQRLSTLNK